MPVNIHGKEYLTVAERVSQFRADCPGHTIKTKILSCADIVQIKASILDESGRLIATGLAEEVRGSTNINKTSALENCETSAIGRALANFGLSGTEFASADEVANAIAQQSELALNKEFAEHMSCVMDNIESVLSIKGSIVNYLASNNPEDLSIGAEAWRELTEQQQRVLWRAPTKGGCFSTREREIMKTTEWREA